MGDTSVLRLLELVCRELEAVDARVEIGGAVPDDPRIVWCPMNPTRRLVAIFDAPVTSTNTKARLQALVASFAELGSPVRDDLPALDSRALASRRLDNELHALAVRAGATSALVIDDRSPVIWGTSEARRTAQEDVETALRTARAAGLASEAGVDLEALIEHESRDITAALTQHGLDHDTVDTLHDEVLRLKEASRRRGHDAWRGHLLTAQAISRLRDGAHSRPRAGHLHQVVREDGFGYLARSFATIYTLLVVFDVAFSELRAEGAVLQALPTIERLVLALPPADPPRGGGKVVRLLR